MFSTVMTQTFRLVACSLLLTLVCRRYSDVHGDVGSGGEADGPIVEEDVCEEIISNYSHIRVFSVMICILLVEVTRQRHGVSVLPP